MFTSAGRCLKCGYYKNIILQIFFVTFIAVTCKTRIHKTKVMAISKEPLGCKLEIGGRMVVKVVEFNYMGVNMESGKGN